MMNIWDRLKERKDEVQTFASLATVVGVLASLAFSLFSLVNSCQAKKATKNLKSDAERVDISFRAIFDHKEEIKLILVDKTHRCPVLTLYAHLTIINLNSYRPIVIEGVEPAFVDGSMPSELSAQFMEGDVEGPKSFAVSSLSVAEKKVRLSWPIDDTLCEFTKLLLEKRPLSTVSDFKLEVARQRAVIQPSKNLGQIVFYLKTTPKPQDGREVKTTLALY